MKAFLTMDSEAETDASTLTAASEPFDVEGSSSNQRVQMNGHDSTTYHPYPASRPFIHTDYQRNPSRPIMSFPESNRDGVLSALRNLQDKMQRLEFERREAENNLHTLTSETERYKTSFADHQRTQHQQQHPHPRGVNFGENMRPINSRLMEDESEEAHVNGVDGVLSGGSSQPQQSRELESQLSSAETRCQLLEKQLDYMRKLVQAAEHDRTDAVQKAEVLQQQKQTLCNPSPFNPDYQSQLDRIGELERDHLRLTATQTLAESKIREMESKLKDEREHRRLLQERAIDLESAAMSHQILLNSVPLPEKQTHSSFPCAKSKKPASSKKKKKKSAPKKPAHVKTEPTKHYRINLSEIPFVAGQATTASHAVGANVQKVLALMKSHNLALCSPLYNGVCNGEGRGSHSSSLSSSSSMSLDQDLQDLLAQLQDEFGQLSLEHQEFMRQINDTKDPRIREDLERELDSLVLKMEAKGQQISRVRQHQQKLDNAKRTAKRASKKTEHISRPNSAMGRLQAHHKHSVPQASSGNIRPKSSTRCEREQRHQDFANPSLNMLRDMKKLQSTLRQDDVSWE